MTREEVMKMRKEVRAPKKRGVAQKDHDIMIKINSGGNVGRVNAHFMFYRNARTVFSDAAYIEVTKATNPRIYFIPHEEKCPNAYKVTRKSGQGFLMTVKEDEEQSYRLKWTNIKFELKYDEEAGMYYIER